MTAHHLSSEEVARFGREGFLLVDRPVFPPARFAALTALFEDLLDRHGHDGLDVPHFHEPRLLDFLLDDAVLDLVEPIIGPDIGLWSSHFISKPPRTGKATPWHEDSAYWDGRVSTMANIVTVWLAIDATDPENGSMGVIPSSHLAVQSDYERIEPVAGVFDRRIRADAIDEGEAVFFTLRPNECSLHEARIIHGAGPNRSARRRAGYTMRYFPTTSRIVPEENPEHRVWLARGQDRAGNEYVNGGGEPA